MKFIKATWIPWNGITLSLFTRAIRPSRTESTRKSTKSSDKDVCVQRGADTNEYRLSNRCHNFEIESSIICTFSSLCDLRSLTESMQMAKKQATGLLG